ncbi:unnamed protein product [Arctogadus glacialis]
MQLRYGVTSGLDWILDVGHQSSSRLLESSDKMKRTEEVFDLGLVLETGTGTRPFNPGSVAGEQQIPHHLHPSQEFAPRYEDPGSPYPRTPEPPPPRDATRCQALRRIAPSVVNNRVIRRPGLSRWVAPQPLTEAAAAAQELRNPGEPRVLRRATLCRL